MPKVKLKDHLELLEILRLWLEDNIDMDSELEFTDGYPARSAQHPAHPE